MIRIERHDAGSAVIGTFKSVVDGLAAKYGPPTTLSEYTANVLGWSFGDDGRLRQFMPLRCSQISELLMPFHAQAWPPDVAESSIVNLQKMADDCGPYFMVAVISTSTGGAPRPDSLINGITLSLTAVRASLASTRDALEMINAAYEKDRAATVKDAAGKKPEL